MNPPAPPAAPLKSGARPEALPPWRRAGAWAVRHGLSVTLAVAALARLVQGLQARASDPFYARSPAHFDMHTYCAWGQAIASGDWLSARFTEGGPFFYGPVYSYFLGLLFTLFGPGYDAVHLVQGALGLLVPLCLWLVARDLFGRPAALATGLLAALCAPLLFYEQVLLMEGLLTALHAVLLWCVIRTQNPVRRPGLWWLAAGLLAGTATLARSNFLLLLPFLAALPLAYSAGMPEGRRTAFTRAGLFAAGAAFILALSLARNVAVSGQWVLTTSNGPMNLYIGNAPDSEGILQLPPSYQRLKEQYGSESAVPWSAELRRALAASPGAPVRLFFRKLWLFWNSYDVPDNVSYYAMKRYYPLVAYSPSTWLLLVPLALSGAWLTRASWRRQLPLYFYAVGVPVTIALVFVLGRYRLPVLLPLLLWSGAALALLAGRAAARRWKELVPHAMLLAAGVALLWPTRSPAAARNRGAGSERPTLIRVNDYNNLAQGQIDAGRPEEALRVLEEGVAIYPAAVELVAKLTDLCFASGWPERAVPLLARFVQLKGPAPAALLRLAEAHARSGNRAEAAQVLQELLRHHPNHPEARKHLAELAPG